MRDLVILGAGGFAREVLWVASAMGGFRVVAFLDELLSDGESRQVHGRPVVRSLDDFRESASRPSLVCGTGSNALRRRWARDFEDFQFATLVHPAARIGPHVELGAGTVVTAGCVLTVDIRIGQHVNLNLNTTVGHDTIVHDGCNLSPGCAISGQVVLGEGCDLGTGAVVLPRLTLGPNTVVGAGAIVTRDLPGDCTAVGVPASVIRSRS